MQNALKRLNSNLFGLVATIIFLLFATILCLRSVRKAKAEYGDKWQVSVYTDNPFRIEAATEVQKSIHEWFVKQGITGPEGAIIEGMTIGHKSEIPKEIKDDFSRAGVSHILALSGFHVSIIYVILQLVFLSRIVLFRYRWITQTVTILLLWTYAFIAGMSPSLVRAVIMCTIFSISRLHTYTLLSLRALAIAFIIMFLIEPLLIFHVGFQLSFLSMLGIHLVGVKLCEWYRGYTFIDRFIWCTIVITLTCTFFTFPIVAYTFGKVPLLGIFTNVIITLLTYVLFFLMFLWMITLGMPLIGTWMTSISHYILLTTKHVAALPYSSFDFQPSVPLVIILYCLVGIIVVILRRNIHIDEPII